MLQRITAMNSGMISATLPPGEKSAHSAILSIATVKPNVQKLVASHRREVSTGRRTLFLGKARHQSTDISRTHMLDLDLSMGGGHSAIHAAGRIPAGAVVGSVAYIPLMKSSGLTNSSCALFLACCALLSLGREGWQTRVSHFARFAFARISMNFARHPLSASVVSGGSAACRRLISELLDHGLLVSNPLHPNPHPCGSLFRLQSKHYACHVDWSQ